MAKYRIGLGVVVNEAILVVFLGIVVFPLFAVSQYPLLVQKYRFENTGNDDRILLAKFSSDGLKVLLVGQRTTQVWSAETGRLLVNFPEPISPESGREINWQPGGNRILQFRSYSYDKKAVATIWDGDTGLRIATISEKGGIFTAKWNSRGSRILSVGNPGTNYEDATYSVRDQNGKAVRTEKYSRFDLDSVNFSNSGDDLIISYHARKGQKAVRICDADTGKRKAGFDHNLPNANPMTRAVFAGESPDGKYLCGQIDTSKGVTCWNSGDESKPIYSFIDTKETGDIVFLGFSDDSKDFAIVRSRQKAVEIIDAKTGASRGTINFQNNLLRLVNGKKTDAVSDVGDLWSKDGNYFVATDVEKEVKVWDINRRKAVLTRPAVWSSENDLFVGTLPTDFEVFEFNSRNDLLLSSSNQFVRVWEPSTGKLLAEIGSVTRKHKEETRQRSVASWSPDGKYSLTAADKNKTVILWTVNY